jgi:hypothetical protein
MVVALALVLWVLATVLVAVPLALVLRRLDDDGEEAEVVDPVELGEAMGRHPSRRPRVA